MRTLMIALGLAATIVSGAAPAQVKTIDPNQAIDHDINPRVPPAPSTNQPYQGQTYREPTYTDQATDLPPPPDSTAPPATAQRPPATDPYAAPSATATSQADTTFKRDDLIGAGEGVFGKGAEGFASIIEKILSEQGEPNAYIAGREAAGAFVVGLRYGSGIMTHKVEGQMPVYWTGPSVGFDVGGDANKVFVLVYNLYDTADLYRRFPAAEGRLYFVGGFAATYLRRGNVVLIPVRLGVGYRAGVNVGYMKFTQKSSWLPF